MYLNTHSYFSMRYGVLAPKELLQLAQENGCQAMVLTDINTTSACIEFIREAPKYNIKPLVGVDFRNGVEQQFIAIAKNNAGFDEINRYLSAILQHKLQVTDEAPEFENTFVIYPFQKGRDRKLKKNEYLGIRASDLVYLRLKKHKTDRAVILQTVSFTCKRDFNTHRLLRAIANNTLLSRLPESEQASVDDQMMHVEDLLDLYRDFPELIINTKKIVNESSIFFDFSEKGEPQNQKSYTGNHAEDFALLNHLCNEGLNYRYQEVTEVIYKRIQAEIDTIEKMGFVSYFLINWDIVSYARSKGYFYVGRGSGANSIVAYLLRITDVDPIELNLYFERFINLYRVNPPDFDIDFSWKDREDMTRYIFERFKHVALVATFNTFQRKGAIRELGKVFGLPKEEIDQLSRGMSPQNHMQELVIRYAARIQSFPNLLSIHASGIIISEKPLTHFSATFLPPKGYPTVQFDMHLAEDVKLYKFDILSQRGLSKIKDALEIIRTNAPHDPLIDIHDIKRFKADKQIKILLSTAKTIGCFYVESPAMRMLLSKLKVDDYLGLVAASSVIRPGVAQSGMMQEYIKRFRDKERRKDAHPILLEIMPETFGVMVYQEDVIKVAHHFAGLSLAEADKMRRGMSGKYRSREEFQAIKDTFFNNCAEIGHPPELTAEIWRQTESFAGYAFAKGHSASYAVESFQCLFLKAYYPLEFMVATINNYGGFYQTELYVHEARQLGAVIHPPCINKSSIESCIEQKNIYLGFHLLHGLEEKTSLNILKERRLNGPFIDFDDFIDRVPISLEQLTKLIRIDAFRFTGRGKKELLWEAHVKTQTKARDKQEINLFRVKPQSYSIPPLSHSIQENTFDQLELLGFPLNSIFSILSAGEIPVLYARELSNYINQEVCVKGYLVHAKRTTSSDGRAMFFGTFLDEEGEWLDSVHFPIVAERFPLRGRGVYVIRGRVSEDYDFISIEANYLEKLGFIEDPRYAEVKEPEKDVTTSNSRKDYWGKTTKTQTKKHTI